MKEWLENPQEYKMYLVQFQGKEYQLLSEVLFAIIMNEIKQAMSTVRKEHKQALKMREEYMKATRSITKQSSKNFRDLYYLT